MAEDTMNLLSTRPVTLMLARAMMRRGGVTVKGRLADAPEEKLYDLAFRSLRPREFVSLSLVGEWEERRSRREGGDRRRAGLPWIGPSGARARPSGSRSTS